MDERIENEEEEVAKLWNNHKMDERIENEEEAVAAILLLPVESTVAVAAFIGICGGAYHRV